MLGDRKCGGSAQRRLKHWFMVHCSILYDFPIERIVRYLAIPRRQPEYRQGRDHHDFLSNLGLPRNISDGCDPRRRGSPARARTEAPACVAGAVVGNRSIGLESNSRTATWIERL